MTTFIDMLRNITPEVYAALKLAVEIGKWSDGRKLTQEQKELCLQAMIAWEQDNLPEEERTGYMGPQACKSEQKDIPNILFSTGSGTVH
ncbi:hypothetical protein SAMN05216271_0841 [Halopseudomonas sabulinigri]|uniref:DUF1315 family protein n=1 Tax=Halopseudomonas sabulinigri TaxID=472181 RepID=A0A1H1NC07_9GAMM|nr:DUF1315 family protein [Halopseudomonas sabulinigri]SDR96494.1 hypothetical protein SAMN05216271_0841 [Halopseudomonas sabulinigri]